MTRLDSPDNVYSHVIYRCIKDERDGGDMYQILRRHTEALIGYIRRRSSHGEGDTRWVVLTPTGTEVLGPKNRYLDRYRNDIFEALNIAVQDAVNDAVLATFDDSWAD